MGNFKINIGTKEGKTFHLEVEDEELIGKELHSKINGKDISPNLAGYEFEIAGASDKAGFTAMEDVEGIGLKKILLTYGKGMKKKPRKEGKKKLSKNRPKGLRLRKTVRGKVISQEISQINLKILKQGNKKLEEIFPEQNKPKEEVKEERPKEERKVEEAKTEKPEKIAESQKDSKDKKYTKEAVEQIAKPDESLTT